MRKMRKESIMIKIKPIVTALCLIGFVVLMFIEFLSYFIGFLPETNELLRLGGEMCLLAIAAVAAGGRQPRWWHKLKCRRLA